MTDEKLSHEGGGEGGLEGGCFVLLSTVTSLKFSEQVIASLWESPRARGGRRWSTTRVRDTTAVSDRPVIGDETPT